MSKGKYLIDHMLVDYGPTGEPVEMARFAVFGETLPNTIEAAQALTAPHVAAGLDCAVIMVSRWCEACGRYHPIEKESDDASGDAVVYQSPGVSGCN